MKKTFLLLTCSLFMSIVNGQVNFKISKDRLPDIYNDPLSSIDNKIELIEKQKENLEIEKSKILKGVDEEQEAKDIALIDYKVACLDVSKQNWETLKEELTESFYYRIKQYYEDEILKLESEIIDLRSDPIDNGTVKEDVLKNIKEKKIKIQEYEVRAKAAEIQGDFETGEIGCLYKFNADKSRGLFSYLYSEDSDLNFINNSGLTFGNNTGGLYTELVSGYISAVRVSVGTMISSSANDGESEENVDESSKDEAYQKLASEGGNISIKAEYPLFYSQGTVTFLGRVLGKTGFDLEAFGTQTDDFAFNLAVGLDAYMGLATTNGAIRFYADGDLLWYNTNSQFRENIGVEDHSFLYGNLTLGIVVEEKLNVSFIVGSYSSDDALTNKDVMMSASLLF